MLIKPAVQKEKGALFFCFGPYVGVQEIVSSTGEFILNMLGVGVPWIPTKLKQLTKIDLFTRDN